MKRSICQGVLVAFCATLLGLFFGPNAGALSVASFTELSDAIANGEAEITIENDLEFSALLTITNDVEIDGNGSTLTRAEGYLGGLFSIPADKSLEIDNLTIDGGAAGWSMDYDNRVYTKPETNTGYIRVPTINGESDIIAFASLVTNSGSFVLKNSTVQNARLRRYASDNKTAVYGSFIRGKGDNTIKNSTIKHTGAYNGGGTLYVTGGTTVIDNCVVDDNISGVGQTGSTHGGFMYIADANLVIKESEFSNNFAQSNGGVGIIYRTNTEIKNSTFDHNMVGNDGSVFSFQSKTDGKSLDIEDSIFENNIGFAVTGQSMGTIWQEVWYGTAETPVVYKNLVFRSNTAVAGAAISDYSSDNTYVTMRNIEVYENSVNAGGVLYAQNGHYSIINLDAHDNEGKRGTGIYSIGSEIVIEDSKIANNTATGSGTAINVAAGSITVRNTEITGNSAGESGGGIYVRGYYDDYNPTLILENTIIKDNSASEAGGGIAVMDHEINFSSVTVDNQSKIYDNNADVAGDDFSYMRENNSENTSSNTITLDNISIAGINGIDGWYYDNEGDRFADTDNPTVFTAYIDNNGNIAFYLKAAGLSTGDYDGNGGDTDAMPVTVKYGQDYIVSDDVPVREGFTFTGWNTRPDGSGIALKAGDSYGGSDGWTLYAQWVANGNPATGDDTPILIALLASSALGVWAVVLNNKRRS